MSEEQVVVAGPAETETEIRRSRFLCAVARADDEDQAREFVEQRRAAHRAATHNCWAWVVGENGRWQRSSDDGEPSGTAGVPMLQVLRRRGLTGTVAVVTRWFGGVRLGAGGLVRAYGAAVARTLEEAGTVRLRPVVVTDVWVEHAEAGRVEHALRNHPGYLVFAVRHQTRVRFEVGVPPREATEVFASWIAALTSGRAQVVPRERALAPFPSG